MSSNSLFINSGKKRNSSIIYSVENLPSVIPVSTFSGLSNQGRKNTSHESDGFPPNKRHKGEQTKDARANEDPFGDNEDFTADDLEELDILASQVLVQDMKPVSNAMIASVTDNKEKSVVKNDANTETATFSTRAINCENEGKELHENGVIHCKNADSFGFEVLQEQHNKLRLQFNEVQEEQQIKSGEIKILRDCLRRVESELDQQKRLHLLSEKEKNEAQSQREKEFSKKVQSLQSELQFKEAEMNELRTKLKNCERTTKSPALGVAKVSPRKCSSGFSTSPIARNYFPDKRSFAAEMSPVHSVCSALTANQLSADEEPRDLREIHIAKKEIAEKSLSLNSIQGKVSHRRQSKGSVDSHCICNGEGKQAAWSKADLQTATRWCRGRIEGALLMTMLLSQPVGLQSLGLSHLLNCSSETFTGLVQHHSCCSTDSSTEKSSEVRIKEISSNLNKFQQLALSGINMLILDQELSENNLDSTEFSVRLRNQNDLPGAVHLLPLIEYYLDSFCKSLQTEKGERSPSRCCSSSSGEHTALNIDDCVHNLEDFALAALGVLYHLVSHSQKVGNTLLVHSSSQSTEGASCSAAQIDDKRMSPVNHGKEEVEASWIQKDFVKMQESAGSEESQNHLFNKLLHLSDPVSINISRRRENVQYQSLRVLGKVAESASAVHLHRFHHLLSSQVLLRSLSPDSSCSIVLLVVQLLANLAEHVELASTFCSQSACLFLNLYTYASSRPDKSATDVLWLQLEQEIIRFITKFSLSHPGAIAVLVESDCPCNTEIFKTLIVMLHRQWLTIRQSTQNLCSLGNQAVVQFLRETVMLLHCLSQRDKNFTDHCFVLHLYDQVMHGIKAIFKKLPDLEENEEIALEELCSPEPEAEYPGLEADGP